MNSIIEASPLAAVIIAGLIASGQPALSQERSECDRAELAVRQRVMSLLLQTRAEVNVAVRDSIVTARLARAHCLRGETEQGLQLYERIVIELDPFVHGPDRDMADEHWR